MAIKMLQLVLDRHGFFSSESNSESVKITRYFQILHDQCEQEVNLINDLLDLQRLDAEVHDLKLTTILLQHWLPSVVEGFAERIRHNKQNIRVNISANLPSLVSDLPSLKRILTELLNNACKYTPTGEQITITADAQPNIIQLQVSNSGVEIPVDKLCQVFEKFYRVPGSNFSKQSGTGLGLTLVKKLVEQLNGEIGVTSHNNQTTFTLKFPLR